MHTRGLCFCLNHFCAVLVSFQVPPPVFPKRSSRMSKLIGMLYVPSYTETITVLCSLSNLVIGIAVMGIAMSDHKPHSKCLLSLPKHVTTTLPQFMCLSDSCCVWCSSTVPGNG